ncbi:MAG: hypothetical protein KJO98_09570 [Rhodothermia bacterium]|nr:hypothetical protein [Rhodothermia bacterium]
MVALAICVRPVSAQDLVSAQNLAVSSFTASDGLPNNLTKSSYQDETGFLWIATDGGLVRFDGIELVNFTTAHGLPDNYVKSIFQDSRGNRYIITDGGVARQEGTPQSPRFETSFLGTSMPTDSVLFYPKSMYEDLHGRVWIADARGLVRLSDSGPRRYRFPEDSWPDSFIRTYTLVEDEQEFLIAGSERGHLFVFDPVRDAWDQVSDGRIVSQINTAINADDGSIWFGGGEGIHSLRLSKEGKIANWTKVNDTPAVTYLARSPDGDMLVGSSASGLSVLRQRNGRYAAQKYVELNSEVINHLGFDRERNLVVTSDNGFAIVRRQFFESVLEFSNSAIEALSVGPAGRLIGVRDHEVFEILRSGAGTQRAKVLFRTPEALSAVATDGIRIWAGSRNGSVYLHQGGRTTHIPLRSKQAINSMAPGPNGDVWLAHFKRTEIVHVTRRGKAEFYGPVRGVRTAINVVRYVGDGLYAGGDGESYLLKYVPAEDRFANVSQSLGFEPTSDLQVFDLDISDSGTFWLASNQGLLSYSPDGVTHFESEMQLRDEEIRALAHDAFGNVWIGTGRGLYRLSDGHISQFNRDKGLPNLTVNPRSLVIDPDQRLWVGHYGGVSRWSRTPGETLTTPTPIELGLRVDGQRLDGQARASDIPFGASVVVEFASLSHPGHNIRYQVRTVQEGSEWSAPTLDRSFAFTSVKEGRHGIQVRAQQDGYVWSTPETLAFTGALPWYRKWWAFLIFVAASGAVLYLMTESHNKIRTRQLKTQNMKLEKKVRERTNELMVQKSTIERTNIDLKKALEQNHEFIGIAAHDLRNPLTSLVGFSELLIDNLDKSDPEDYQAKAKDVLPIIHRAATTMHGVIQDMLDSQLIEGGTDRLRPEDTDLADLARTVINMNNSAARRKGITIMFNPRGIFRASVDARSIQRALDNLVSNAIKYSPPSSVVNIGMTHIKDAIRVCVEDEGPGLTLDDREKVFGKLQRLSAKPTGGEMSTGLGLYIVRSIAEMHGGRVGVNSEPGEGAEFWIEIPAVQMKSAA